MGTIARSNDDVHPPSPFAFSGCETYYFYIDTVELFFRRFPHPGFMGVYATAPDRTYFKQIWHRGCFIGFKLILQKPTLTTLRAADRLQRRYKGKLSRFDVALDIITKPGDVASTSRAIEQGMVLKWRRKAQMMDEDNGVYWIDYRNKRRPTRTLVLYHDKPSKQTGELDPVHVELRFLNSRGIKQEWAMDLIKLNPVELFNHHVSFVTGIDMERYKRMVIRRTIGSGQREGAWTTQYKVRRIGALIDRMYKGRIQLMKGNSHSGDYVKRHGHNHPFALSTLSASLEWDVEVTREIAKAP